MGTPLLSKIPQTVTGSETDKTNAVFYKIPCFITAFAKTSHRLRNGSQ